MFFDEEFLHLAEFVHRPELEGDDAFVGKPGKLDERSVADGFIAFNDNGLVGEGISRAFNDFGDGDKAEEGCFTRARQPKAGFFINPRPSHGVMPETTPVRVGYYGSDGYGVRHGRVSKVDRQGMGSGNPDQLKLARKAINCCPASSSHADL